MSNGHNGAEYKKTQSRKWRLVLYVLFIATIGVFIPPLLSTWLFKATSALVILSGGHFVTLVTLLVSAYFGANVWQKRVEANASFNVSAKVDTDSSGVTTSSVKTSATATTTVEADEKGEA
jgi:hypothetical protein